MSFGEETEDHNNLLDDEGVDVSEWLLSEKKRIEVIVDEEKCL